jgi:hypothetical protein
VLPSRLCEDDSFAPLALLVLGLGLVLVLVLAPSRCEYALLVPRRVLPPRLASGDDLYLCV